MKKEFKRIRSFSKDFVERKHHKKLKKIDNYTERTEGLKYLIGSKLKTKLIELESKIEKARSPKKDSKSPQKKEDSKDYLVIEARLIRLRSKIKIFESTHSKKDLDVVKKLINEIEERLK